MTLKEYIFMRFKLRYKGRRNSIRRRSLIRVLNASVILNGYLFGNITDREMRQAYEDLPICGGPRGLYLPETQAEIDEQIGLHVKKIRAYVKKIKILKGYKIPSDSVQKELF